MIIYWTVPAPDIDESASLPALRAVQDGGHGPRRRRRIGGEGVEAGQGAEEEVEGGRVSSGGLRPRRGPHLAPATHAILTSYGDTGRDVWLSLYAIYSSVIASIHHS